MQLFLTFYFPSFHLPLEIPQNDKKSEKILSFTYLASTFVHVIHFFFFYLLSPHNIA